MCVGVELVKYDEMCRAIDAAYEVDEVKDIRDKAAAIEMYARQARNVEAERRACEIRLRAERKAGQLLQSMKDSGERASRGETKQDRMSSRATSALSDLGITRDQSSKWQKLADVPKDDLEAALRGEDKPSTNALIPRPPMQTDANATWLWREGLLDTDPAEFMKEVDAHTAREVLRLAPLVADWLRRLSQ
jgi:hypothetical protein